MPGNLTYMGVFWLSAPIIVSNAALPLLGIVDTAVIGHTENAASIGAVAVGALIFSFTFWLFGFLKMVTSGLTAQALGRSGTRGKSATSEDDEISTILARALLIAVSVAVLVICLQKPIFLAAAQMLDLRPEVESLARAYFDIRIWAAPATLAMYCFVGWLIGMQRTGSVMTLVLFTNFLNIALDLLFVVYFRWSIAGVAVASLIAEYAAVFLGAWIVWSLHDHNTQNLWKRIKAAGFKDLLSANIDMMIRTLCLELAFVTVMRLSSKLGVNTLAANTVLLHFFSTMAYVVDGFAHTAEALTGEALGRQNLERYKRAFHLTLHWTLIGGTVFSCAYLLAGPAVLGVFTDLPEVIAEAKSYLVWAVLVPTFAAATMHFDGVFIGATRTREMRNAMLVSLIMFWISIWPLYTWLGNHGIWAAFLLFMIYRGLTLGFYLPRLFKSVEEISE